MPKILEIKSLFEDLTGNKLDEDKIINNLRDQHVDIQQLDIELFKDGNGLGFSQFNEILSLFGLKRVHCSFFQFLVNQKIEYKFDSRIKDLEHLKTSIEVFLKFAILMFGNVKFAFKVLTNNQRVLLEYIIKASVKNKEAYTLRDFPIKSISRTRIPKDKTYLLGYISSGEIVTDYENNPEDKETQKKYEELMKYRGWGIANQATYLTYDHMDVYVATSMRMRHEFIDIDENVSQIFNNENVKDLKLRYFNPTQAYCHGRIDKGLSEALMLKRASCTIYFVQETDTLGKDSELASTLAQGKPVIAFVPEGNRKMVDGLLKKLSEIEKEKPKTEIILDQLNTFSPNMAWRTEDKMIRKWIDNPKLRDEEKMLERLYNIVETHYDKRANMLKSVHPLGIQVNLKLGVANGVLVVRNVKDCAKLLRRIVLNEMKFDLVRKNEDKLEYLYLKEQISECVFRVQTGDTLLTNSFWNFYNTK